MSKLRWALMKCTECRRELESPIEDENKEILCGDCISNEPFVRDGVFTFVKWLEDENGEEINEISRKRV